MAISKSPTGSVNFLLSASIFSILSVVYLEGAPRFLKRFAHPFAALVAEGINTIFYFAGFIALTVHMGSLTFCVGVVCSASRADAVIAAGAFCTWIASTILTAKKMIIGGTFARRKVVQMWEV
jgi:hypothetical protein